MTTMWGIHCDEPSLDFVGNGFVSIGWDDVGDLAVFEDDVPRLRDLLGTLFPSAKQGALPVWAGVLNRFAFVMKVGDWVVFPSRADSTINIGKIAGEYFFDRAATMHKHRRIVEWIAIGLPRSSVTQSARFEIGSAVTLFQVRRHPNEFLALLPIGVEPASSPLEPAPPGEELPTAIQIESYTSDRIRDTLLRLDPAGFEQLTSNLLRALGYQARTTQYVGDGGVDVIAHRDPLGVEPPILKIQCKRTETKIGIQEVQGLKGTLQSAGEFGVFVTLGGYTTEALRIERSSAVLRLIDGNEFISLLLAHYDGLSEEWRSYFGLRRIYVFDDAGTEIE
jgi:restriction system protein